MDNLSRRKNDILKYKLTILAGFVGALITIVGVGRIIITIIAVSSDIK